MRGVFLKTPPPTPPVASSTIMRAEIEHLVDEAKQSVGLLRRHL
jgi:hypothetical protein